MTKEELFDAMKNPSQEELENIAVNLIRNFCITKNDSWTDELIVIFLTISMLFIGFSREKDEDECIASIRMNALVWAIMVNSSLLIVGTLLIYGLPYLNFMSIYMFSLLILFVFKYRWMIYKFRKTIE